MKPIKNKLWTRRATARIARLARAQNAGINRRYVDVMVDLLNTATKVLRKRASLLGLDATPVVLPPAPSFPKDREVLGVAWEGFLATQVGLNKRLSEIGFPPETKERCELTMVATHLYVEARRTQVPIGPASLRKRDWSGITMTSAGLQLHIGERISSLRKERGLTQATLAAEVALTNTSIARIEAGKQRLALPTLYAIAKVLQISPAELLPKEAFREELSASQVQMYREKLPEIQNYIETRAKELGLPEVAKKRSR